MSTDRLRLEAVGSDAVVIVVIGKGESGESASTHAEWSEEDVVFQKSQTWSRATVKYSHDIYRRGNGWRNRLVEEKVISAAEAQSLIAGHTPQNVAATKAEIAQWEATKAAQDAARPNCPKCGKKMAERSGRNGAFWGCSDFPKSKCNGTRPMR